MRSVSAALADGGSVDIVFKLIVLQAVLIIPVFFLLCFFLQKELLCVAFEKFLELKLAPGQNQVDCVDVVSASRLSDRDRHSWTAAVRQRFGNVPVNFLQNRELGGGIVLRAGSLFFDHSLSFWFRRLQGGETS